MARKKNPPESQFIKNRLSERLRAVRTELYGARGGPELARNLGIPNRTWYNYEVGVTVPAEILLRFLEITQAEPQWLLHGQGPRFRESLPAESNGLTALRRPPTRESSAGRVDPEDSIEALLREVLRRLEHGKLRIQWEQLPPV